MIAGVHIVRSHRIVADDLRGRFISAHTVKTVHSDLNIVVTKRAGTIRGLHMQAEPWQQAKLIQVIRGRIFDVAVFPDGSAGNAEELGAEDRHALMIPGYLMHGYQTLEDDTIVVYQTSEHYRPDAQLGLRWDDPSLGIEWPMVPTVISERDMAWPLLETAWK